MAVRKLKDNRKKAIILRKSRDNKEEVDALNTHRHVLTRMCVNNGWEYDIYGGIVSGFDEKEHMEEFMENIQQYDGVLCMDIDRLGRDDEELAKYKKMFYFYDIEVITPHKTYDFENEADDMHYSFEALLAKLEGTRIKKRMKRGKVDKFKDGQYTQGKPPIGYRRNPQTKKLEIHEEEAKLIRMIFEMSAEGYGGNYIAEYVTSLGYRSQKGKIFPSSHIKQIQKNKIYTGVATLNVHNKRGELVEVIEQECPQIVSLELYLKAQDEIHRRNNNKSGTRGYVKSMLSGLIRCTHCGRRMSINKMRNGNLVLNPCDTKHLDGTKCKNGGVKLEEIEKDVLDALLDFRDDLYVALQESESVSTEEVKLTHMKQIEGLQKRLDEIQTLKDDLEDRVMEGFKISAEKYNKKIETWEKEIGEINLKIKHHNQRMAEESNANDKVNLQSWINVINDFRKYDLKEQNEFLKTVIDAIDYDRQIPDNLGTRRSKKTLEEYPFHIHINWRT